MSITFKLRNGEVKIPENEIESICIFDWYISKLINNNIDNEKKKLFEIWEDYDVFITIIDSVRFNKLILKNDSINLDYLLCLADKWCIQENIINQIKKEINKPNILEDYINSKIQRCTVCYNGFKIDENHSEACSNLNGKGYHVHKIDIELLKEYKEIYKLFTNKE